MKNLRLPILLSGLVAMMATGCIIISGQIFAHFDLPSPFTIDSSASQTERIAVDLNTIDEYEEHKEKFKGLSDVAIVGTFTNVAGAAGAVEVWITAGTTTFTTKAEVLGGSAIKLWGPGSIGAAPASRKIGWDESAKLFTTAGKRMLIDEAKGDGAFTLYTIGTAGTYEIRVDDGALILTISAGL